MAAIGKGDGGGDKVRVAVMRWRRREGWWWWWLKKKTIVC